jgi:DNA-binding GntR family transcriptional regulator
LHVPAQFPARFQEDAGCTGGAEVSKRGQTCFDQPFSPAGVPEKMLPQPTISCIVYSMQQFDGRANLAEEVSNLLRDMILDGRLPAGERINEVHLAAQIGVSRTPLREALSRLVNEGALRDVPRRGFFVCSLTEEEVRAIYPIRSILDPAALRLAGLPSAQRLAQLRRLNRKLAACTDPAEAVRLDDELHLELLADCPNPVLISLIRQFMWRTRRYELGLMRKRVNMANAVAAHERIFAALEQCDMELACKELEGNMSRGEQPILEWLSKRGQSERSA